MRRLVLSAGVVLSALPAHAQPRVPFAFDAGLGADPVQTQAKLAALIAKVPTALSLPATFETLGAGPDGVTPPTVTLWLAAEAKAAYLRAADAGSAPMQWPPTTRCTHAVGFAVQGTSLLASGAAPGCSAHEASVRAALSPANVGACLDVEEPERYVTASRAPATLAPGDSSGRVAFADAHTGSLEAQIAFAGAALALVPVPAGVLPPDWVDTSRTILWKLRPAAYAARASNARAAFASALATLGAQAACFDGASATALTAQVQALDAELAALAAHVTAVQAAGTARADLQRQCLATRGRTRPALAYPSLTDEEREQIAFWLGGVYWRMRGGGLFALGSTQSARSLFARRPFKELAHLATGTGTADRAAAERAADSIYCGLGDGWGQWMDLGTSMNASAGPDENQDFYEDLVQMTDRGRQHVLDFSTGVRLFCIGQGVLNIDKSPEQYLRDDGYDTRALFAGGISMGPCYAHALNPMKGFTYFTDANAPAPYSNLIEGFTTMGELCTGGSLGLGLVRSLLNGKPTGQPPTNLCAGRTCGTDECGVSCGGPCASSDAGQGGGAGGSGGSGGGAAGGDAANAGGTASPGGGPAAGGAGGDTGGGAAGGVSAGGAAGGPVATADAGTPEPEAPQGCGCGTAAPGWMLSLFAGVNQIVTMRRRRKARLNL